MISSPINRPQDMTIELKQILVFKTNIRTVTELLCVQSVLNDHPHIQDWSIDQQDVDCVLRIITPALCTTDVVALITNNGFECTELDE